jgi:hypothetical protein
MPHISLIIEIHVALNQKSLQRDFSETLPNDNKGSHGLRPFLFLNRNWLPKAKEPAFVPPQRANGAMANFQRCHRAAVPSAAPSSSALLSVGRQASSHA